MKKIILITVLLSLLIGAFTYIDFVNNTQQVKYMYSDNFGHYFISENDSENEVIFINKKELTGEFLFNNTYIISYNDSKNVIGVKKKFDK